MPARYSSASRTCSARLGFARVAVGHYSALSVGPSRAAGSRIACRPASDRLHRLFVASAASRATHQGGQPCAVPATRLGIYLPTSRARSPRGGDLERRVTEWFPPRLIDGLRQVSTLDAVR